MAQFGKVLYKAITLKKFREINYLVVSLDSKNVDLTEKIMIFL